MKLIRECEHCGAHDEVYGPDEPLCERCLDFREEIRVEAMQELSRTFEAHIILQPAIIKLLTFYRDNMGELFRRCFGHLGIVMLDKAIGDIEAAEEALKEA